MNCNCVLGHYIIDEYYPDGSYEELNFLYLNFSKYDLKCAESTYKYNFCRDCGKNLAGILDIKISQFKNEINLEKLKKDEEKAEILLKKQREKDNISFYTNLKNFNNGDYTIIYNKENYPFSKNHIIESSLDDILNILTNAIYNTGYTDKIKIIEFYKNPTKEEVALYFKEIGFSSNEKETLFTKVINGKTHEVSTSSTLGFFYITITDEDGYKNYTNGFCKDLHKLYTKEFKLELIKL